MTRAIVLLWCESPSFHGLRRPGTDLYSPLEMSQIQYLADNPSLFYGPIKVPPGVIYARTALWERFYTKVESIIWKHNEWLTVSILSVQNTQWFLVELVPQDLPVHARTGCSKVNIHPPSEGARRPRPRTGFVIDGPCPSEWSARHPYHCRATSGARTPFAVSKLA